MPVGLTLETLVVAPIALVYMTLLFFKGDGSLFTGNAGINALLIGAGPATAIPLLYFSKGAQKIPLSLLGLLQYIAPTLTLLLGIFIYGEPFSKIQLLSFMFIWCALSIYSLAKTKLFTGREFKFRKG
jgi:chloramphenicol-sensitive protein RarD